MKDWGNLKLITVAQSVFSGFLTLDLKSLVDVEGRDEDEQRKSLSQPLKASEMFD